MIIFSRIFSRKWWYFGVVDPKFIKGKHVEYWECEECRKK
jgi:hypothetical protein